MRITRYALQRRIATLAIATVLIVLGLYGLRTLPVDFLPSITYPLIRVHVWWQGATPEEIDRNLADPIERQMATVDDLDYLESSSIEGMYTLLVNFKYGVDVETAYQDALAAMARAARELPPDIEPPIVIKADPSQLPVLQLTVSTDQWDMVRLRTWTDEWLQDQLVAVTGVAGTEIVGGLEREIRVQLDPAALEKHGLTLDGVNRRLREENVERFGGRVTVGPKEIIARTVGEYTSLEEIRDVVLLKDGPAIVRLRDVAEVIDSHEEARVITRRDGAPCVKVSVLKQATANTVEVSKAVAARIRELEPVLPEGLHLGMVENQAEYIEGSLRGVQNAALEAALLVVLLVWLFLGSWRQVLVLILALPLTLIANFGLMRLAGFSLNIFSLGGLVIAIGVLLDNSIVVIENVTRRRHESKGAALEDTVVGATSEIGPALVAATLSFLALFVPFLIVPGLTSLLFRELILVIAGIVVVSLAVAVAVTPLLTALLLGKTAPRGAGAFERLFIRITEAYGRALERVICHPRLVIASSVVVVLGAGLLIREMGSEFLPQMDDGRIMIKVKLPTGASVGETDAVLRAIEGKIAGDDRIESSFTLVGGRVWGLYTYEIANEGEIDLQLLPRSEREVSTRQYIEVLRPIVAQVLVPGGTAMVSQMKLKGIRSLGQADIEVKIKGQDLETLFDLARSTSSAMTELEHFRNINVSMDMTKPEYQVRLDRARASEMGVTSADVGEALRGLVTGTVATRLREGGEYYGIRVLVPESRIRSRQDLEELPLTGPRGGRLRVRDIAEVRPAVGPVEIARENQIKQVVVRGDLAGASVGEALAELREALGGVNRPPGYGFAYGGQAQMMGDMKRNVMAVLAFAAFFAFAVLAVQFNSVRLPAVILASVPVCLAGLVLLMFLTGLPLGATVIIGALVVIAAAVNDGVLLLTFARELEERERTPPARAIVKAAKVRLRPRVMTTASVLVGLIPLALRLEEGGDLLQPMAVGAVGGLGLEILVALFLMPCLYLVTVGRTTSRASIEFGSTSKGSLAGDSAAVTDVDTLESVRR